MGYRVINGELYPIGRFPEGVKKNKASDLHCNKSNDSKSFVEVLNEVDIKKSNFIFSKHAAERLKNRNINFTKDDITQINDSINKAESKGARDCLILFKNTALITNVKNRTVVTAVDKESSRDNVFTNIDSVIIV